MYKTRKSHDPYNPDNNEWRVRLRPSETKKIIDVMKYINVNKRATVLMMALEEFRKKYGAATEK